MTSLEEDNFMELQPSLGDDDTELDTKDDPEIDSFLSGKWPWFQVLDIENSATGTYTYVYLHLK